jgi:DNA-binding response OmpR family regulator
MTKLPPAVFAARGRLRVLIAESEPEQRSLMVEALSESGYRVESAHDGNAAWDLMLKQTFDLIISDVWLARITGLQLTRRNRRQPKPAKVILLTAAPGGLMRGDAFEAGANDVLAEPYILHDLTARAQDLLMDRERQILSAG